MEVKKIQEDITPIKHDIQPVFNEHSKILILGTFPSVKSREVQFFYSHPQNRFWKVLATVLDLEIPSTIDEKKKLLLDSHIALWDVIASCTITGSSDSSISNVKVNELDSILRKADIQKIYTNGAKAHELYYKYCYPDIKREAEKLPSTSPANATYSLERLLQIWNTIKTGLEFK